MADINVYSDIIKQTVVQQLSKAVEEISLDNNISKSDLEEIIKDHYVTPVIQPKIKKKKKEILLKDRCRACVCADGGRQCKRPKKNNTNYCSLHQRNRTKDYNSNDEINTTEKSKGKSKKKTNNDNSVDITNVYINVYINNIKERFIYNADLGNLLFTNDLNNPKLYGKIINGAINRESDFISGKIIKLDPDTAKPIAIIEIN